MSSKKPVIYSKFVEYSMHVHYKYKCNTFTPQIKGICCGLNVMYHIPQLSKCATTSHWNAYNYATTFNGTLQKYQGALIQIPKTPLLIKQNILILIVGLS